MKRVILKKEYRIKRNLDTRTGVTSSDVVLREGSSVVVGNELYEKLVRGGFVEPIPEPIENDEEE